jgi:hypothetical protein
VQITGTKVETVLLLHRRPVRPGLMMTKEQHVSAPIHVTCGNHAAPQAQRGLDPYPTPACAVTPLLDAEPRLPRIVWDPCGPSDSVLAATLRARGFEVIANDIAADGIDFLERRRAPDGAGAVLTNPPFSRAAAFVRHGLTLVPKVVVLECIQFLESQARADLFDAGTLARVWVFRARIPRMHREDWAGKRAAPAMCLSWFIFARDHDGSAPTIGWLSC